LTQIRYTKKKFKQEHGKLNYGWKRSQNDEFDMICLILFSKITGSIASASNTNRNEAFVKSNGSDNFYVAKNTGDPHKHSETLSQFGLFPEGFETSA